MAFKNSGTPCDLWNENVKLNPSSFATVQAQNCYDDWRTQASIGSMVSRPGHVTDATAYATQPSEDSWYARFQGTLSPAKVTAGSSGTTRQGQLT